MKKIRGSLIMPFLAKIKKSELSSQLITGRRGTRLADIARGHHYYVLGTNVVICNYIV